MKKKKTQNLKKREKKKDLLGGITYLKINSCIEIKYKLAYRQFKKIPLHERVVDISNNLSKSVIKAKW